LAIKLYNLIFTLIITSSSVCATGVTIPNSFSSGTATSAAEMNANFDAVKASVDDNDSRITTLESSSSSGIIRSKFMGFSTGTTDGAAGVKAMAEACNTSFSGSHICSYSEYINSNMTGSENVSGTAWIRRYGMLDSNGISTYTCSGWANNVGNGLFINSLGQHSYTGNSYPGTGISGDCSIQRYIACCK